MRFPVASKITPKSSAGRNGYFYFRFWKFLFFSKTARLKGKEKKLKEMKSFDRRQLLTGVNVDKSGLLGNMSGCGSLL